MSQPPVLSMLHGRASLRPNDVAFTFTNYEDDWAGVAENLTWSQLSRRTLNVARELMIAAFGADVQPIIAAAHTAHNLILINFRSPGGCTVIRVR